MNKYICRFFEIGLELEQCLVEHNLRAGELVVGCMESFSDFPETNPHLPIHSTSREHDHVDAFERWSLFTLIEFLYLGVDDVDPDVALRHSEDRSLESLLVLLLNHSHLNKF